MVRANSRTWPAVPFLLKLEQRGHIQLPARRQVPSNRMRPPLSASLAVG